MNLSGVIAQSFVRGGWEDPISMLMMASSWQLLPNALSSESWSHVFQHRLHPFFFRSNQVVALTTVLSVRSLEFRIKCAIR